jgi:hypothetical protein
MSTTRMNHTVVICRFTIGLNIPNEKETTFEWGGDMEAGCGGLGDR